MMRSRIIASTLITSLLLTGCATTSLTEVQKDMAIAGGFGATAGALIAGDPWVGAAIGGALGAGAGYLWSHHMESKKSDLEKSTTGTDMKVTRSRRNIMTLSVPYKTAFVGNQDTLSPAFMQSLNQVALTLKDNPNMIARLVAYTYDGLPESEQLSLSKMNLVWQYLLKQGVSETQMVVEGRYAIRASAQQIQIWMAHKPAAQ